MGVERLGPIGVGVVEHVGDGPVDHRVVGGLDATGAEQRDGIPGPGHVAQKQRGVGERLGELGAERDRLFEEREGLGRCVTLDESHGEQVAGGVLRGVDADGFAERVLGAIGEVEVEQRLAEIGVVDGARGVERDGTLAEVDCAVGMAEIAEHRAHQRGQVGVLGRALDRAAQGDLGLGELALLVEAERGLIGGRGGGHAELAYTDMHARGAAADQVAGESFGLGKVGKVAQGTDREGF